jgi:molybdopterin synthase sulfur carrier subunit
MKVRVQYTAQLRTAIGRSEEEAELPDGSTLAGLLSHLAARHNHVATCHLFTPTGQKQKSLLVVVNESAVTAHQSDSIILRAGDVVALLPPIAGG